MIESTNRITTQFSEVTIETGPRNKPASSLGFYSTCALATRVADFVQNTFSGEFAEGIDVSIERRSTKNEIKQLGEKIGFIDTPPNQMGAIYTISNVLDREEIVRIVDRICTLKEIDQKSIPFSPPTPTDHPAILRQDNCHVMYELPITTNTKPLGIYSSHNALHSVINFLSLMNIDYQYRLDWRDVVVFSSGKKATFIQNSNQESIEDQTLMRVANRLDLLEIKRIIQSLSHEESNEDSLNVVV